MNLRIAAAAWAVALALPGLATTILTDQHVDIGIGYDTVGSAWDMHVHNETDNEEYEPGDVLLQLTSSAIRQRPNSSNFDFIGVGAGQNYWRIFSSPTSGILYLGIGTEETGDVFESYTETDSRITQLGGNLTGEWVTLRVKSFTGPGQVSLWSNTDNGPLVWFATSDGIGANDYVLVPDNSHQHFEWGFSQAGRYDVTFEASGIINGQRAFSGDVVYSFEAVPEPMTMTLLGLGLAAVAARRRRK